jgi:DNA-binding response OmpR family regulator
VFDWGAAALSLGADRVLLKPFDQQRLLSVIQEVLAGSAKPADAVPPSNPVEQRKYTRLPVYFPASFGDGTIEQTGTVLDIFPEGCRIRCPEASPALQYFQVQTRLIDPQDTLKVDLAVKRWARNGDIGVEFIRLEPAEQRLLRLVIWTALESAWPGF